MCAEGKPGGQRPRAPRSRGKGSRGEHSQREAPRRERSRDKAPQGGRLRDKASQGERLQKVLAHAGLASRRKCEEFIVAGRVKVNGRLVTELGTRVDPESDLIEVDGQPVVALERETVCYLLYKPGGYLSTVSDPHGRPTALSLVPSDQRLYPVGRLDLDSEGLLLFTNDGALAHRLMHPRFQHEKEYLVMVQGHLDEGEMGRLGAGVHIDDEGKQLFVRARVQRPQSQPGWRDDPLPPGWSWVSVTLREGKKRQIRRMFDVIGHPVRRLIRVREGSLELGALKPGEGRWLTKQQVRALRQEMGLEGSRPAKHPTEKDTAVEKDHYRHRRSGGIGQKHGRRPPRG